MARKAGMTATVQSVAAPDTHVVGRSLRQIAWRRLRRDKAAVVCAGVLATILGLALFAPLICSALGINPYSFNSDLIGENGGLPVGRLGGVSLALKERNPKIRIVLADPEGAALYNYYAHGELKSGQGYEAYVTYKGVTDLTIFGGVAFDNQSAVTGKDIATYNIWASYKVDAKTTVAAEFAQRDGGGRTDKGSNWLFLANYQATDKVNCAFRISGEKDMDAGTKFVKYTVAPGIALTKDLTVRAEYSLTDARVGRNNNFFGVQAYVKF